MTEHRVPPWKKKAPKTGKNQTLTPEQKAWAMATAKKAGRRYPNLSTT